MPSPSRVPTAPQGRRRRAIPGLRYRLRSRRGTSLIEYTVISGLYFTLIFGIVEFTWICNTRQQMLNGCYSAMRTGVVGNNLETIREAVRSSSGLSIADEYILVDYNTEDDATGTWVTAEDDPDSGSPPIANDVESGKPLRVKVSGWPYTLLAGNMFTWLPNVTNGQIPVTVSIQGRRQ